MFPTKMSGAYPKYKQIGETVPKIYKNGGEEK